MPESSAPHPSPAPPPPAPALVEFVLRHLTVRTAPGSLQRCDDGSFHCAPRTIGDTNLIYMMQGRAAWYVGEREHVLTPGTLVLSPRLVPHRAESRSQRVTLLSMHLIPTLPGGQDAFDVLSPPQVQMIQPGDRLDAYLRAAAQEYDRPDPYATAQALNDWATLIAREVLRHGVTTGTLTARPVDPVVSRVLERLDDRLATPTTLEELAEISGYTPQHLNRLFRRALGVTPLQHLTHLRMRRAAELLVERRLPLAVVAEHIGMTDPYYFSRLFKRHFGKSPSRYRDEADS